MPQKKVTIQLPGLGPVDAVEVSVLESTERWTELKLDDGSVVRVKPVVMGVVRLDNRYDPEGNPMYALKAGHITMIASAPDHLRRGAGSKEVQ